MLFWALFPEMYSFLDTPGVKHLVDTLSQAQICSLRASLSFSDALTLDLRAAAHWLMGFYKTATVWWRNVTYKASNPGNFPPAPFKRHHKANSFCRPTKQWVFWWTYKVHQDIIWHHPWQINANVWLPSSSPRGGPKYFPWFLFIHPVRWRCQ